MKNYLLILTLLFSISLQGQKKAIPFGDISPEVLKMKSYAKDKDAKAVVLFDKGKSIFFDTQKGYDIRFTKHKRIKVFDKTESKCTEISIPYYVDGYGRTEIIKSIKAVTYNNVNGALVEKELNPSTIYDEQINEQWHHKKFVFPDVQDGSILEYQYVLETPFHFNLPDWTFQDQIPTIYSEYEVSMIPFYEYVFIAQGLSKFDYQNSVQSKYKRKWGAITESLKSGYSTGMEFNDVVHTYILKDVPAFKDESYITSINDYIIKMDFQLAKFHSPQGGTSDIISTWPSLNKALLKNENFGKYIKTSARLSKKILEGIDLSNLDEQKRAEKIINYVKNNFKWNGFNSKYSSQSSKDFLKSKVGNSADINLFLIALLKTANISVDPLILSTRAHGKISSTHPFDKFTNYVIALVDIGSSFLADGTDGILPYNRIPTKCFNEKGIVVNEAKDLQWIDLTNKNHSFGNNIIQLTIDDEKLEAQTVVSMQFTSYNSYAKRKEFRDDTTKIKEYYNSKIGDINLVKSIGYTRFNTPYSMYFESTYDLEKIGNSIVITPFLDLPLKENQLTQKNRTYPVDFIYSWEDKFESRIDIPTNYTLAALPEDYKFENDLVEINLEYNFLDGTLNTKGNYKFKKSIYAANEYKKVKFYLDEIIRQFNQQIVLEKVN